eukprot:7437525-Karenia_brevis.AAC.1
MSAAATDCMDQLLFSSAQQSCGRRRTRFHVQPPLLMSQAADGNADQPSGEMELEDCLIFL